MRKNYGLPLLFGIGVNLKSKLGSKEDDASIVFLVDESQSELDGFDAFG